MSFMRHLWKRQAVDTGQRSRGGAHLSGEKSSLLGLTGNEPSSLLFSEAVASLRLLALLCFTQFNGVPSPCFRAAGRRPPCGRLVAPATFSRSSIRLVESPLRLLFAGAVVSVASEPVDGVVRICSRHPWLQVLTTIDHHWPERESCGSYHETVQRFPAVSPLVFTIHDTATLQIFRQCFVLWVCAVCRQPNFWVLRLFAYCRNMPWRSVV